MTQKEEIKKKNSHNTTPPISSLISVLHSSVPTRHNKPQAGFFFCKHLEFMRRERKREKKNKPPVSCCTVYFTHVPTVQLKVFTAWRRLYTWSLGNTFAFYGSLIPGMARRGHRSPLTFITLIKHLKKIKTFKKNSQRAPMRHLFPGGTSDQTAFFFIKIFFGVKLKTLFFI